MSRLLSLRNFAACLLVLSSVTAIAQEETGGDLDLIIVPPARRIDWSSPGRVVRSYLPGVLHTGLEHLVGRDESAMGHAIAHFRCVDDAGELHENWSGFTGDNNGEGLRLVRKGHAFGVLFARFTDGAVESDQRDLERLSRFARQGGRQPLALRVRIDSSQCSAVARHLARFRAAPEVSYGFVQDPLTYEGAGCTSYAASYFKVAGLEEALFDRFKVHLEISTRHIGRDFGNRGIPLTRYLGSREPWNRPGDRTIPLDFYDPQKMYDFIRAATLCAAPENTGGRPCELARSFAGDTAKFESVDLGLVQGVSLTH